MAKKEFVLDKKVFSLHDLTDWKLRDMENITFLRRTQKYISQRTQFLGTEVLTVLLLSILKA